MKKVKFYLMLMLGLLSSIAVTACSGDDEPSMSGSEEIMAYINGRVFRYQDISTGDESVHDYNHSIQFTATSEFGGTFEHECFWKDISDSGVNSGRVYDEGSFTVKDGKISISIYRGDTWYIKYFTVSGDNLVGDNGDIYKPAGTSSDTPVSSHKNPLDYYQTQYNYTISMIIDQFTTFDTAKAVGDTVRARQASEEIKRLQAAAKSIRNEAKQDGWTIQASPYETKSAYV